MAHHQRGAISIEYAGVILVAALVVGSVFLAVGPSDGLLAARTRAAICEVFSLGQGDCHVPTAEEASREPTEPCVVNASGADTETGIIAVVKLGRNDKLLIQKMSDGTYRVTEGSGGYVGAGIGVGFDISGTWDDKTVGLAASAAAGVEGSVSKGNVYEASSQDQVKAIIRAHAAKHLTDGGMGLGGIGPLQAGAGYLLDKFVVNQGLPPVSETYLEGKEAVEASAHLSVITASGVGESRVSEVIGFRQGADGTSTAYYDAQLTAKVAGNHFDVGGNTATGTGGHTYEASARGSVNAIVEVERDQSGSVTAVTVRTAMAGSAMAAVDGASGSTHQAKGYIEHAMTLTTDNDADRATASAFLHAMHMESVAGLPPAIPNPGAYLSSPLQNNPVDTATSVAEF
ncbi:MAG: hypothetical protein ACK5MP_06360, partial [Nostocoides sp.]